MRIAIVTESYLPAVNGVTNSVLRLLEHSALVGHEVLVVAPGKGADSFADFSVLRVPSVSIPRYRSFQLGIPTLKLRHALSGFGPDVLYVAAPFGLGARALQIGNHLRVPTVACFQTDVPGFLEQYGLKFVGGAIWKWLKYVHNLASRTLAPSQASVTDLCANGVNDVYLWRRGVDGNLFHPSRRDEDLRSAWNLNGRLAVGYVGRLAHEKRVGDLQALAADERIKLVIVGDGPQRASLQRELPDAEFAGFRTGEDLARHFASFDMFVHPGLSETFCQTIQEALASGVPVVAPAKGGPIDLVSPLRNGLLFEPNDLDHFRRCVSLIVGEPELREQLSNHARKSVEERSWRMICGQWDQHLAEVVSEHRGLLASVA